MTSEEKARAAIRHAAVWASNARNQTYPSLTADPREIHIELGTLVQAVIDGLTSAGLKIVNERK